MYQYILRNRIYFWNTCILRFKRYVFWNTCFVIYVDLLRNITFTLEYLCITNQVFHNTILMVGGLHMAVVAWWVAAWWLVWCGVEVAMSDCKDIWVRRWCWAEVVLGGGGASLLWRFWGETTRVGWERGRVQYRKRRAYTSIWGLNCFLWVHKAIVL